MSFLLTHWHCILPIGVIAIVFLFNGLFGKQKGSNDVSNKPNAIKTDESKSIDVLERKFATGEITEADYRRKKALIEQ